MGCDLKKTNSQELLVKEMDGIPLEIIWPPCTGLMCKSRYITRLIYFEVEIA